MNINSPHPAPAGGERTGPATCAEMPLDVPLVVDLDGTLVLTDTLYESFLRLALDDTVAAVRSLRKILAGKAAFKRHVAAVAAWQASDWPLRAELVDLMRVERARGRRVHLVTAADQRIAEAVSVALGLFESATGSNGSRNLKGRNKLAFLQQRFPEGFIYAGDDRAADQSIFAAAQGAILCDIGEGTAAALRAGGTPVLACFNRPRRPLTSFLRALRPHQWSKNILIFVPLLVGHAFDNVRTVGAVAIGFAIMCLLASASYMLNDLADLSADRRHPTKRLRPFASGDLSVAVGAFAPPLMILAAFSSALLLSPPFAMTLLAYLALTLLYSGGIKRVALLDVFVIGVLFTLRIVMGAQVAALDQSPWLLSFSVAFFLSLAAAKRHAEVISATRKGLTAIPGRGYQAEDWPLTLTFGVGVGLVSTVIMLLYMTNDAAPSGFYDDPSWLYAIPALVTLWLMRVWLLSHRALLQDDPVVFALRDRASLLLGVAVAVLFLLAM